MPCCPRVSPIITAIVGLAVVLVIYLYACSTVNPVHAEVGAARARHARHMHALHLTDQGRFVEARAAISEMIENPDTDFQAIEAHRLMSRLCRAEGNIQGAEDALRAAITEWNERPNIHESAAALRVAITIDLADIAAFERDNTEEAIRLYDQAVAAGPQSSPRDYRIAAQNAAMLSANRGRYGDAVRRLDELLASSVGASMSEDDVVGLKASQASWAVASGDLDGGYRRYVEFWNEFGGRNELCVLEAGVRIAGWYPVPQECGQRLELCRALLAKVQAIRGAATRSSTAPSDAELDDLERSVLVVLADSEGCPDNDGLIARARATLGLP